ncbi:MAG TPA: DUF3500 domain-containing protein, partial [Devosia sp.]|nr:DUF3500 domain-containing protein [Devosia sp.]
MKVQLLVALLSTSAWMSPTLGQTVVLNEDGSAATTGLVQPGQDVIIPADCADEANQVDVVVCAADQFLGLLSEEQKSQVVLPLEVANSTAWSNLPCGTNCRVGVVLADLSEEQQTAALAVVKAATSEFGDDGYDELTQITMADDILGLAQESGIGGGPGGGGGTPNGEPPDGMSMPPDMSPMPAPPDGGGGGLGTGAGGYDSANYLIAFLGQPSTTDTWQLQFGGHHLALLKTYANDAEVGSTPAFSGVEPKVWQTETETFAPLEDDREAMRAMLAGLTDEQRAAAKLDQAFSDVILGPGEDGQFPAEKVGLRVGDLDAEQKQLVLAALGEWVRDTASTSADQIMAAYEAGIDDTYIAFSGSADLANHADYVRIDGPRAWVEF